MNQPAEEDDDAGLARNVAILRERMDAEVVRLRKQLDEWIAKHTCHGIDGPYSEARPQFRSPQ
jgi:hypothetical protein